MIPSARRQHILKQLADRGTVRISQLSREMSVSAMTVRRDLATLAAEGRVRRVHGGAVLVTDTQPAADSRDAAAHAGDTRCPTCYHSTHTHTQVVLHLRDGGHQRACCPHCGLMQIQKLGARVQASLVTDFISGQTVNAHTAVYVVAPDVTICCTPTVIAFQRREDARRFQQGFNGQVVNMQTATETIFQMMDPH